MEHFPWSPRRYFTGAPLPRPRNGWVIAELTMPHQPPCAHMCNNAAAGWFRISCGGKAGAPQALRLFAASGSCNQRASKSLRAAPLFLITNKTWPVTAAVRSPRHQTPRSTGTPRPRTTRSRGTVACRTHAPPPSHRPSAAATAAAARELCWCSARMCCC